MYKTQLETSELGSTRMQITRVGFGSWAIGGAGREFGWGPQEDEQSVAAIHRALDEVIHWIDGAAAYGFGQSDEVVGRALQGLAEKPYVFTNCSLLEGPGRTQRNPAVYAAIVRFRRPGQVDPILAGVALELTSEDVAEIEGAS
jgi:aryl-alcohol dehydrogenase-like predicted oxidoreductase